MSGVPACGRSCPRFLEASSGPILAAVSGDSFGQRRRLVECGAAWLVRGVRQTDGGEGVCPTRRSMRSSGASVVVARRAHEPAGGAGAGPGPASGLPRSRRDGSALPAAERSMSPCRLRSSVVIRSRKRAKSAVGMLTRARTWMCSSLRSAVRPSKITPKPSASVDVNGSPRHERRAAARHAGAGSLAAKLSSYGDRARSGPGKRGYAGCRRRRREEARTR